MMGILWVTAIATVVAVEKLTSRGVGLARLTGVVLIALALWDGVA